MNLRLPLACALAAFAAATPASARAAGLNLVVTVVAEGVHVPQQAGLRAYAARPWPRWRLAPGTLTPHGAQLMTALGAAYRARYARAGMFGASGCKLDAYVYARALLAAQASAQALLDGLAPGCNLSAAGAAPGSDPVFDSVATAATPDAANAFAAPEDRSALDRLNDLLDCASSDCKRVASLEVAANAAVALRMQYDDGLPGAHVGWGHLDYTLLRDLTRLPVLRARLDDRSAAAARAKASNLATSVIEALQRRRGFAAFVGSAADVAALGGLLGASWTLPGNQADDVPPGGALVFELHQGEGRHGEPFVRTSFVAQPDDAMRRAGNSPIVPVQSAPVRPAGCPNDDCPLHVFEAAVRAAIAPPG